MIEIIKNKKASFDYEFLEIFTAGIILQGFEIKSIREHKTNLNDSFCFFVDNQLYSNFHISEHSNAQFYKHDPKRNKKLLLTKNELKKLSKSVKIKGLTIIPYRIFINDKSLAKIDIAICRGKKLYDKKNSIKERDLDRDLKNY